MIETILGLLPSVPGVALSILSVSSHLTLSIIQWRQYYGYSHITGKESEA